MKMKKQILSLAAIILIIASTANAQCPDPLCLDTCAEIELIQQDGDPFDWEIRKDGAVIDFGSGDMLTTYCIDTGCYEIEVFNNEDGADVIVSSDDPSINGIDDLAQEGAPVQIEVNGGCSGCTDSTACNYDSTVPEDDGSCILPDGCTDSLACNYDSTANCDDGGCCYENCVNGLGSGPIYLQVYAENNPTPFDVTIDGLTEVCLPDGCYVAFVLVGGVTDTNFSFASYSGNTDDGPFNFSLNPVYGCMDTLAVNYDSEAICDDGNCTYCGCGFNTVDNSGTCEIVSSVCGAGMIFNPTTFECELDTVNICGINTVWDPLLGQCVGTGGGSGCDFTECTLCERYDSDSNGDINTADLLSFLTFFGTSCSESFASNNVRNLPSLDVGEVILTLTGKVVATDLRKIGALASGTYIVISGNQAILIAI